MINIRPPAVNYYIWNRIISPSDYCDVHVYADDTILYVFGSTANQALFRLQSDGP